MKELIIIFFGIAYSCSITAQYKPQATINRKLTLQQLKEDTRAGTVFKRYADSTVILETSNPWFLGKDALIVSKKGDNISCFSYKVGYADMIRGLHALPDSLRDFFMGHQIWDYTQQIEVNPYMKVIPLAKDEGIALWKKLSGIRPWQLQDDKMDGDGCPVDSSGRQYFIADANTYTLQLITKQKTEMLSFYAPEFYEEQCPGRKSRQKFITLHNLLKPLNAKPG